MANTGKKQQSAERKAAIHERRARVDAIRNGEPLEGESESESGSEAGASSETPKAKRGTKKSRR